MNPLLILWPSCRVFCYQAQWHKAGFRKQKTRLSPLRGGKDLQQEQWLLGHQWVSSPLCWGVSGQGGSNCHRHQVKRAENACSCCSLKQPEPWTKLFQGEFYCFQVKYIPGIT